MESVFSLFVDVKNLNYLLFIKVMNDFLRGGVWVLPQIKEFIKKEKGHFSPFPALIKVYFSVFIFVRLRILLLILSLSFRINRHILFC